MHRRIWIAAAAGLVIASLWQTADAQDANDARPPATQPAAGAVTEVPVRQVVLFNSGVGYFEHGGKVNGDAAAELRFKTDQVNDILKSLLLQDLDGGTVGTVSYPGLAPLAHTLKSFEIDITANPDIADLLNQLRGAKITVRMAEHRTATGVILGVEKKNKAVGEKGIVEIARLNLKTGREIVSVNLDDIGAMELDDPKLQKELDDALAALAKARDQDKKPMTLHFAGKGERRVRIGYLVETPVWKTSYRLVFGAGEEHGGKPGAAAPATLPATNPAGVAGHGAKMQGWAIVENQTDFDWNNISLSLVSGRPMSFIEDLYHSRYLPRPIVQVDNSISLRPQTYAGGIDTKELVNQAMSGEAREAPAQDMQQAAQGNSNTLTPNSNQGQQLFANQGGGQQQAPMDATASVVSAASAARVGELFKYRIANVSLARQTSAMIPIVNDDIDAEKVSIYNMGVLAEHPLLGARVKNNTGKFLLEGPITVVDHGSYAGDARIEDLPPGQRLVSFGIDQQVLVEVEADPFETKTVSATIQKGILTVSNRVQETMTYTADNKSPEIRELVIEHARGGPCVLAAPAKAEETTPNLYRFRRSIPPHTTLKFKVTTQRPEPATVEISKLAPDTLAVYTNNTDIPLPVRQALMKAISMRVDLDALNARYSEQRRQMDDATTDQTRIRENLKSVAAESDYYKRLMKKIDEQENTIEKAQKAIADVQAQIQAAQKQLNEYIANLNVAG